MFQSKHMTCSVIVLMISSPRAHAQMNTTDSTSLCTPHLVQRGDTCSTIAQKFGVELGSLETYNKDTWGWRGCSGLQAGDQICVSAGSAGLPPPVDGALCGPTVPGTKLSIGQNISALNPCPLKACCSAYGYCGTTAEFCTPSITANSSKAGCISNCGTDIISASETVTNPSRIAYFQAYNENRPCLHMQVTNIDKTRYTHVHYSFAALTRDDFRVDTSLVNSQLRALIDLRGIKRIITLGGWTFSTAPDTYMIFRDMVRPENRDTAVSNIAAFVLNNDLDGVDIDWEYPGAPDIPGIPAGRPDEGDNFVEFLSLLKGKLVGKSLSIALPASYWYLKNVPVERLIRHVDYVVYMTYDYHGLWEYGNPHAQSGCPSGNCLRSHVNLTETFDSLSMLTKAGVESHKIVVGVSSYGRGFRMSSPKCTDASCTWDIAGEQLRGECTAENGILAAAEIDSLLAGSTTRFHDGPSDSAIAIVNGTWWVAYLDKDTISRRSEQYARMHFGGTADWSVDLQSPTTGLQKYNTSAGNLTLAQFAVPRSCSKRYAD
ncbi:hypothetical protein KVT40_001762 [Elsinoe batatas]|uniref:chitinase n=1 Tax=Elsinoe batatas TaxID=2601811 RepID=A0A8K0LDC8_9PEZI|nr:hypothetical protein KVT40_001762 [Elsinoe batatas]